jgi:predicted phosphate transport protein (TIGR00153 family)
VAPTDDRPTRGWTTVRLSLRPQTNTFYDMFTASANNLLDGAQTLHALITGPRSDREALAKELRNQEHRGDDHTHGILREVNATFVTPIDREDIYRLASRLDDVMDFFEAAGDLIVLYELDEMPPETHRMAELLVRAAELTSLAMPRLRSLSHLSDYWVEINRLENEADKLHRRFVARLFGGDFDALTVLKLKEIAEELENAADAFENVADTVETIAVKES